MNIVVTGSKGFIGRNLVAHLRTRSDTVVLSYDVDNSEGDLREYLACADFVFHLAGVNRPQDPAEFETGNADLTRAICDVLRDLGRTPGILMSSSIQAAFDNPYGVSKRRGEEELRSFAAQMGANARIYRLKNVFGKWCRPNYNSVVATFCHSIANDLPFSISEPSREIELVYIDDVVSAFLAELPGPLGSGTEAEIPSWSIGLGDLAGRIQAFHDARATLRVQNFGESFNRALFATYLSYVPACALQGNLAVRTDIRGSLAEFIKSDHFGQLFVSRTKPGVTRGNHYHHTKAEKFFVVEGDGLIRMRQIDSSEVFEYRVRGDAYQVIAIPPGYTHSIENIGSGDMVTLFWASETFNPDKPDTYFLPVLTPAGIPVSVTA